MIPASYFSLFFFGLALPKISSTIMNRECPILLDCGINEKISKALPLNMIFYMTLASALYQPRDHFFYFHCIVNEY